MRSIDQGRERQWGADQRVYSQVTVDDSCAPDLDSVCRVKRSLDLQLAKGLDLVADSLTKRVSCNHKEWPWSSAAV